MADHYLLENQSETISQNISSNLYNQFVAQSDYHRSTKQQIPNQVSFNQQQQRKQQCGLCQQQNLVLQPIINHALFEKYSSSQDFFNTRQINELLDYFQQQQQPYRKLTKFVIDFKENQIVDEDIQAMKRFYAMSQYRNKISMISEYHKFERYTPKFHQIGLEKIMERYYDRMKNHDYKVIKHILKIQKGISITTQKSQSSIQDSQFVKKSRYSTMLNQIQDNSQHQSINLKIICQQIQQALPGKQLLKGFDPKQEIKRQSHQSYPIKKQRRPFSKKKKRQNSPGTNVYTAAFKNHETTPFLKESVQYSKNISTNLRQVLGKNSILKKKIKKKGEYWDQMITQKNIDGIEREKANETMSKQYHKFNNTGKRQSNTAANILLKTSKDKISTVNQIYQAKICKKRLKSKSNKKIITQNNKGVHMKKTEAAQDFKKKEFKQNIQKEIKSKKSSIQIKGNETQNYTIFSKQLSATKNKNLNQNIPLKLKSSSSNRFNNKQADSKKRQVKEKNKQLKRQHSTRKLLHEQSKIINIYQKGNKVRSFSSRQLPLNRQAQIITPILKQEKECLKSLPKYVSTDLKAKQGRIIIDDILEKKLCFSKQKDSKIVSTLESGKKLQRSQSLQKKSKRKEQL